MEKAQAEDYLTSLLNKTFRVHTTDTRMFLGQFRCTDSDRNIILSQAFEYRHPPIPKNLPSNPSTPVVLDMTSRFLGLVVVPGEHIAKIEVEEFKGQMRDRKGKRREMPEEDLTVGEIGGGEGANVV